MKIAVVGWGKVGLLAAIPLGYLGLCWWYAPPWWLTLVSDGVLNTL